MFNLRISKRLIIVLSFAVLFSICFSNKVNAATLSFNPASGSFPAGCQRSIDIIVDATGQSSNAMDTIITYNPTQVSIIDSEPDIDGIQVRAGNAYESLFYNFVDPSAGTIKISAGSFVGHLNSRKTLATVTFTSSSSASAANFTFDFDGAGQTLDSNIADTSTSNDLLTSVSNVSYSFVAGSCVSDNQAPTVNFISPSPYQNGFTTGTVINFTVNDSQSGVDLSSLIITINGITYQVGDSAVSYSGSPSSYNFIINYPGQIPEDESSIIQVIGRDLAGNPFTSQIVFNVPPAVSCPTSFPVTPGAGGNNLCTAQNILNTINSSDFLKNTILKDSIIDKAVENLGVSGTGALLTVVALLVNILPFLSLLNAPGLLIGILGFILGAKSKKTWGLIIDAVTKKPVPLAVCRLYQSGTLYLNSQTVSDLEGRYGFPIGPGNFRLEIVKEGYQTFKKEIKIGENEVSYVYDIFMSKKDLHSESSANTFKAFLTKAADTYKGITPLLFVLGFILSIASLFTTLNAINISVFLIYLFIILIYVISKLNKAPKYSAIVDSETKLRIPFAVIKFFDLKTRRLADTQVSNNNGQFDFFGEPGEYAIFVANRGYSFPSKIQKDLELISDKNSTMLKVKLKKGRNMLQIYLDPQGDVQTGNGNLSTPFG